MGSPAQGSYTRKMSLQNIWIWKPVGLTLESQETGEIEASFLKGSHKSTLQDPGQSSNLKGTWVRPICLILET